MISNIDDVLLGHKTNIHPETPENKQANEVAYEYETEAQDNTEHETPEILAEEHSAQDSRDSDSVEEEDRPTDEYGNEVSKKVSKETEREMDNESIRKRLAKQAQKYESEIQDLRDQLASQGASREVQNAARDFEYNPEAQGDWQQQLASFVKQTVNTMSREEENKRQQAQEAEVQSQFEAKFHRGMSKFNDFQDVMMGLEFEITNPMTLATRAMDDPAAFLYAAAKRNPKELERISKMRDPYAQMTEMGKLEERMRKNKAVTNAPRPMGRTTEDVVSREPKKSKEPTIEDLIKQSETKKLQRMRGRQGARR